MRRNGTRTLVRNKGETGSGKTVSRVDIYLRFVSEGINSIPGLTPIQSTTEQTQIPQYILNCEQLKCRRIAVTQPRRASQLPAVASLCLESKPAGPLCVQRIAAVTVARRVAEEVGCSLRETVGYTVRFDDCTSERTRLRYMTDGVLLREAVVDPTLAQYGMLRGRLFFFSVCVGSYATGGWSRYRTHQSVPPTDLVIVDEAHERTLDTDVLVGLLKRARRKRPELRVLVMSATLDPAKFSDFHDGCPVFSIPGRMFPVEILHHADSKISSLRGCYAQRAVETALHIHKSEEPGDVLVFLTGGAEIENACRQLAELERNISYRRDVRFCNDVTGLTVLPVYGSLETMEQRAIFERARPGHRKVVFSTNIAQTSVTIPNIRYGKRFPMARDDRRLYFAKLRRLLMNRLGTSSTPAL
ncbi:MAG: P-loop containing nucleoside triphosphate hydrolase protein [Olpidium bornovanus]|uniref:P-loop containing nucleoside triphosphate hydrolase protein n=1 Tax=Olpidium bornovanus TaxID=278681 RepID=A0A8H7ZSA9_9FUNG|nr:MAG: P-loop containing nucleoside triphosphate hydrolase protein [Olpidium bornovanus]